VPKSLEIDQDNLHMKFSALNVDFNCVSFDPQGSRSPLYEGIKFGYHCSKPTISVADRHRLAACHKKQC